MSRFTPSPEEESFEEPVAGSELDTVLRNFRTSVHAWSEAAYSQPRHAAAVRHTSWRRVAVWALGLVVAVGGVSGGLYEHHSRQEQARIAAVEAARQQQKLAAEEKAAAREKESEELAKVDSDVSREVPSAMEPLAQMMDDDGQ